MRATGDVFRSRDFIGDVEPPAAGPVEDISPFGNDGTFLGAGEPDWVKTDGGLWVLDFDGSDDEVTMGTAITRAMLGIRGSISLWVKPDAITGQMVFNWTNVAVSTTWIAIFIYNSDFIQFTVRSQGVFQNQAEAQGSDLTTTRWHHLVCVCTGSAYLIYVDGLSQAITMNPGINDGRWADDMPDAVFTSYFGIGNRSTGKLSPYEGLLGFPRIYNRTLDATEIADIFQAERSWFRV